MDSNPYSGLEVDSITPFQSYIDKAKECGMKAIAFTEHGAVLHNVAKKQACEKAGIKYIHAEEFYVTEDLLQEPNTDEYKKELEKLKKSLDGCNDAEETINEFIDKVQDCSLTNLSALYLRIDQLFHYHRISGNQNTKDTIALACNVKNWLYV